MTIVTTSRRARRLAGLAAATAAALLLAACSAGGSDPTAAASGPTPTQASAPDDATEALLAAHQLAGLDARAIIDTMDALPMADRPDDLVLSIRPDELVVKGADGTEGSLPMPADAFYVSIAPYEDSNHDCYYHSLTTCMGELGNEGIHVTATDATTGEVLVDEDRTTFDNGFAGLWLPRDREVDVTVEARGKSASAHLSTGASDDATCVTTMRLA